MSGRKVKGKKKKKRKISNNADLAFGDGIRRK